MRVQRLRITAFIASLVVAVGISSLGGASALAASSGSTGSGAAVVAKHKTKKHKKKLTRAEKLKQALKKCKKDKTKKKRTACEKAAKSKYGKKKPKTKTVTKTVTKVETKVETKTVNVPGPTVTVEKTPSTPTTASTLPTELGAGPKEAGGTKAIENPSEIPSAPAFTPTQLNAWPSGNYLSGEGGTTGDHYSTLTEITPENVANLKGDWMQQLDGSGIGGQYSGEASPTVYDGVEYQVTGADDVFAVSLASGKILWVHPGNIPASTSSAICCGWDARGLSIGDGMVFTATLNGDVEALNQQTGQTAWVTELGQPSEGLTITSAPLYYEGMVFIGPVGAEYGVRGFMAAFNATTGAMVWKHWNIPAPGEAGHDSWPSGTTCAVCNNEWKHGGATTWNAPTVDPKRGLILYSTANAGNDNEGYYRYGDNLWTVSMLALNYKTGEMTWGYQEVHHDIWDYDASNQPTMINVEINGKRVEGIVQADKDGFAYFVNDENGQPVFPITEEKVPTNAIDDSAETQPIPQMPPFYPQKLTATELAAIQTTMTSDVTRKETELKEPIAPITVKNGGYDEDDVFGAWAAKGETTAEVSSDALSGDNEAPSSYDPSNGYYYVCSRKGLDEAYISNAKEPVFTEGDDYAGGEFLAAAGFGTHGYLMAYNMKTGEEAWHAEWEHECYSGITTTAGNVLFTGTAGGELLAYNATTGKQLLSFQLGAGVGGPQSVYEFEGKERVGVYAGGNEFDFIAGDHNGDNLWQLSLSGTMGPLEATYYTDHPSAVKVPKETTDY